MYHGKIRRIPALTASDIERFESKIIKDHVTKHWLWQGARSKEYGVFAVKINGDYRPILAHRVAWRIYKGCPKDLCVLHDCDHPPCVNPKHLFLGTQADNMRDCAIKGRAVGNRGLVVGEKHGLHKLTWDIVDQIRASDLPQRKLAKKFGVHQTLVSLVQRRKIWKEEMRDIGDEG